MSQATFQTDTTLVTLGNDCYGVWNGNSQANIKRFPRTIGGVIKPTKNVDKTVTVFGYLVTPDGTMRTEIEGFFNSFNEQLANKSGTLTLSGNAYVNCYAKGVNYDRMYVSNFIKYTIPFLVGDQDTDNVIRQLGTPDLYNWSRGRKATFFNRMEDGSVRAFQFWHNVDSVHNLEVNVNEVSSGKDQRDGKIVTDGGFERIICDCWMITHDEGTRKTIEAYMFNMINGPLGRVGSLCVDAPTGDSGLGKNIWHNVFFESVDQDQQLFNGTKYTIQFLMPLQC